MRTTIEIPDDTHRLIKTLAAQQGETFRDLVLEGLELVAQSRNRKPQKRFELPIIRSSRPGSLDLTNEQIDDILFSS